MHFVSIDTLSDNDSKRFMIRLLLLIGLGLASQAADAPPFFVSANPDHIWAVLTVQHPTAQEFSVEVTWQDEGVCCPQVGFFKRPKWTESKEAPGQWEARLKMLGDTNLFRVTVFGTTNWSNYQAIIPTKKNPGKP